MVILRSVRSETRKFCALWPAFLIVLLQLFSPTDCRQVEDLYDINVVLLPNVRQQVLQAGSNISITCIASLLSDFNDLANMTWRLPDYLSKYPELSKARDRLHITWDANETHVSSTITLADAGPRDTGYYECYLPLCSQIQTQQYIYVFSENEPVIIDDIGSHRFTFKHRELGHVPCKPTHPNVTVTLRRTFTFTFEHFFQEDQDPTDLLSGPNPNWVLEPKRGLTLKNVSFDDFGIYECIGRHNSFDWKNFAIVVSGVELTEVNGSDDVLEGSNVTLICRAYMFPLPPKWAYLNSETGAMQVIDETRPPEGVKIVTQQFNDQEDNLPIYQSRLEILNIKANSPTQFLCKAIDYEDGGIVSESITLRVIDVNHKALIVEVVAIVIVLVLVAGIGIGFKLLLFNKKRKVATQAKDLLKRKCEGINQNISVDEQTDALPYNKRWEFPRHRLKLGIQLGVGCFGRVIKAEAVGMKASGRGNSETVKTVAVKMVRSQNNTVALEALVNELKILIYLGSHLNVLNLLGACTKNISKGELLVIVEYCRFGNLQTYLINHRKNFINQVNEMGNMKVDGGEALSARNFINEDITECASDPDPLEPKSFWYYQQDPDAILNQTISTRDLVCWSFQIARGMDYLASKKVLHGDLAARNVLLADDGIVKVADFGMSRKMYYEPNYQKKGQGLMPVKWMAIESLTHRIFSPQSDIWSYGIFLWELFSLGKVPYPGMEADHQLISQLQNGYRMDKPSYAPNFMGEIMKNCWKMEPAERPTFNQLEEIIGDHLEASISSHYLNLNVPYTQFNEDQEQITSELANYYGLVNKLLKGKSKIAQSQSLPINGTVSAKTIFDKPDRRKSCREMNLI